MSFIDYLASLPAIKLDQLYDSHWTCQAVLRSLPPLAKQYVIRLLYVGVALSASELQEWARPEFISKHRAAIERMEQLRVMLQDSKSSFRLNPAFQERLKMAFSAVDDSLTKHTSIPPSGKLPSSAELDKFALTQWENVLLQLVSSTSGQQQGRSIPQNRLVTEIMLRANLVAKTAAGNLQITEKGFQFLLSDTHSQLWEVVREFVSASEGRGVESGTLISFLLELGFYNVGEAYRVAELNPFQQTAVRELEALGLVKLHNVGRDSCFLPTRLAASLSASLSESASWQPSEGNIVVETNFRIYTYTVSKLQSEILKIFERVEYCLPNLVVGTMTHESCNNAFSCGISANQIIEYLQKHAHPKIANRKPAVPENVTDQIRLWEHNRNRVTAFPSVLYFEFPSQETFLTVAKYAEDIGALLWQNVEQGKIVVREDLHDQIRTFIRRLNAGSAQSKPKQ